jgi:hypothetical protein
MSIGGIQGPPGPVVPPSVSAPPPEGEADPVISLAPVIATLLEVINQLELFLSQYKAPMELLQKIQDRTKLLADLIKVVNGKADPAHPVDWTKVAGDLKKMVADLEALKPEIAADPTLKPMLADFTRFIDQLKTLVAASEKPIDWTPFPTEAEYPNWKADFNTMVNGLLNPKTITDNPTQFMDALNRMKKVLDDHKSANWFSAINNLYQGVLQTKIVIIDGSVTTYKPKLIVVTLGDLLKDPSKVTHIPLMDANGNLVKPPDNLKGIQLFAWYLDQAKQNNYILHWREPEKFAVQTSNLADVKAANADIVGLLSKAIEPSPPLDFWLEQTFKLLTDLAQIDYIFNHPPGWETAAQAEATRKQIRDQIAALQAALPKQIEEIQKEKDAQIAQLNKDKADAQAEHTRAQMDHDLLLMTPAKDRDAAWQAKMDAANARLNATEGKINAIDKAIEDAQKAAQAKIDALNAKIGSLNTDLANVDKLYQAASQSAAETMAKQLQDALKDAMDRLKTVNGYSTRPSWFNDMAKVLDDTLNMRAGGRWSHPRDTFIGSTWANLRDAYNPSGDTTKSGNPNVDLGDTVQGQGPGGLVSWLMAFADNRQQDGTWGPIAAVSRRSAVSALEDSMGSTPTTRRFRTRCRISREGLRSSCRSLTLSLRIRPIGPACLRRCGASGLMW